jgi:hypothetical protein
MATQRNRSALKLGLLVAVLFLIRWPIDTYMCSPATWHSQTLRDKKGNLQSWRQPGSENSDGDSFFSVVFTGGGGTPAIFAMLGGQRYLVANILWAYSDVLFHQGKPYDMVRPLEAAVTLNPSFTEAWSVYGWHLAWNLHTYTNDLAKKAYFLKAGEVVFKRAVEANPEKPKPYFDLAWLYLQRTGAYEKACAPLEAVVYGRDEAGKPLFKAITPDERKREKDLDQIRERKWDPQVMGNRLGYVYKKLGIVTGDREYFTKSIAAYEYAFKLAPYNEAAKRNADDLRKHMHDDKWLASEKAKEAHHRTQYGMSPLKEYYNKGVH